MEHKKSETTIAIGFMATLAFVAMGTGSLLAGSLEPPQSAFDLGGNPLPTPAPQPTWEKTLSDADGDPVTGCNSHRFICVMANQAVLDLETHLVWERAPANITLPLFDAARACNNQNTGGRTGWRLPRSYELMSLVDRGENPTLPILSPFVGVQSVSYWTGIGIIPASVTHPLVDFSQGETISVDISSIPSFPYWCVRGGMID